MKRVISGFVVLAVVISIAFLAFPSLVGAAEKPCKKKPNEPLLYQKCANPGAECRLENKDAGGNTWVLEGDCRDVTGVSGFVKWTDCLCRNTKKKGIRQDAGRTRWQFDGGSLEPSPGDQFSFRLDTLASNTELHWYNMHTVFDVEGMPVDSFEAIPASDLRGDILFEWGDISDPQAIEVKVISFSYSLKTTEFGWVDFVLTSADAFATYNSSTGELTMLEPYEDAVTCRCMEMNGGTFPSIATFNAVISGSEMDMLQASASLVSWRIPTLTEWGMIIFCALLFGWMAWVIVRRRRRVTASI